MTVKLQFGGQNCPRGQEGKIMVRGEICREPGEMKLWVKHLLVSHTGFTYLLN